MQAEILAGVPMKATLVFTSDSAGLDQNPNFDDFKVRDDHIGKVPPLSLLYVAALLEKDGVECEILDVVGEGLTYEQALERIRVFSPDIVGFTLSTYCFGPVLEWINKIKEDTGLPIIVGGAHAALYPKETMVHEAIDYLVVGEAEYPLPEFVRAFWGDKDFSNIKSLAYRKNGEAVIDLTRQAIPDIDDVPLPALHLLEMDRYHNIISKRRNFTAMLSSRGCPYKCTFCDQKTPSYRTRSPEGFVGEILRNYNQFGIREFDIYDSTFTADKKRVKEICKLLVLEDIDIGFTIRSRVDSVDHDVLDHLQKAGCHTIFYGVESADADILRSMRKEITLEQIEDIVGYTKKIGIDTLGYFMIGYPGETKETMEKTIQFAMKLPLDYAQFTVLTPFPDTEIYEYYMHNGLENYWSEYTLDPSKERPIEFIGTNVTRAEASDFVHTAYRRFYFRPRIIRNRLSALNSPEEFRKAASAALGILKGSIRWGTASWAG